jgi:hypothetical protein
MTTRSVLSLAICASFLAACSNGGTGTPGSTPPSQDIVHPGDGVVVGPGWYALEHYNGLTFRWAKNDAEITVCPDANARTLAVLLEPGPGVGSKPLDLTITGNRGDGLTTTVKGRQYVKVSVAAGLPAETFALHAKTRNLPSPNNDKRILNYRALDMVVGSSIKDCINDIDRDGTVALGPGWYKYETYNGRTFRWIDNNAQIIIPKAQTKPFQIALDVAPGASLGSTALDLSLRNAAGKVIASTGPVATRSLVTLSVPSARAGETFTLSTPTQNAPVPNDPRKLNAQVFAVNIKP